jgi:uncharacterized protein (TIGR02145 family)
MLRSLNFTAWFCIAFIIKSTGAIAQKPKPDASEEIRQVQIGNQIWTSDNLGVTRFRNGDPIQEAENAQEWSRAARERRPAWCYYENDPEKGKTHGKLYNWYAVTDPRGLAPEGWHVPSKPEITQVVAYLDSYFKDINHLDSLFVVGLNDSPEHSLYADQSGYRLRNGMFANFGQYGFWWGNTCYLASDAWLKHIRSGSSFKITSFFHHGDGFSVRCIRD